MSITPLIARARVVAVDVPSRRLMVSLPSTQIVIVQTGYHGQADGLRISHKALPIRGTEGLVVFPSGDNRNGVWLMSIYVQQVNALTTQTDANMEYDAHWSGFWRLLDGSGNLTNQFPDGTFIQIGSGTTPPATTRNIVNAKQEQEQTPVEMSDRVAKPPSPFNVTVKHATGTTLNVAPNGDVSVSGGAGNKMTMTFGGTVVTIDSQGLHVNNSITAQGNITAGSGTNDSVTLQLHTHKENGTGGGTTNPPNAGT
jgi:hypothetical protein